jgi:hypothetical protein
MATKNGTPPVTGASPEPQAVPVAAGEGQFNNPTPPPPQTVYVDFASANVVPPPAAGGQQAPPPGVSVPDETGAGPTPVEPTPQAAAPEAPSPEPGPQPAPAKTYTQEQVEGMIKQRVKGLNAQLEALQAKLAGGAASAVPAAGSETAQQTETAAATVSPSVEQMAMEQRLVALEADIASERLRSAVVSAAAKLGFADPMDAFNLLDKSALKQDGGKVVGLDDALKALSEAKPYLVRRGAAVAPANPSKQPPGVTESDLRRHYFGARDAGFWGGGGVVRPKEE